MSIAKWVCAVPLAACLAACAATPETGQGAKENTGTAIGAVTGALIGSQFGGNLASHLVAGVAGAAIGGLIGNRIGASMDEEDKKRAYAAQMQALEGGQSGAAVTWKNPDFGPLRHDRPGASLSAGRQHVPAVHAHDLHRRKTADCARRCLPQPGRDLDFDQLNLRRLASAIMSRCSPVARADAP